MIVTQAPALALGSHWGAGSPFWAACRRAGGARVVEDGRTGAELVSVLSRWRESGAVWRVLGRRPSSVTVALLRCDGGEEVERLTSGDPLWVAYLDGRRSSED